MGQDAKWEKKEMLKKCFPVKITPDVTYWHGQKTIFHHTCQRKKRQRAISMGANHTALKYTTKSMSFWVSAETRLTISPTVQVLLAELFITKDWIDDKTDKDIFVSMHFVYNIILNPQKNFRQSFIFN